MECPSAPVPSPRPASHAKLAPVASGSPRPRRPAARQTQREPHRPGCPVPRHARPGPPGSAGDHRLGPAGTRPPAAGDIAVDPSMSMNKNMSVCVATSPRLLMKVDANSTGQKASGLFNPAAQTSYVHYRSREFRTTCVPIRFGGIESPIQGRPAGARVAARVAAPAGASASSCRHRPGSSGLLCGAASCWPPENQR
jgi:hypothetical protein